MKEQGYYRVQDIYAKRKDQDPGYKKMDLANGVALHDTSLPKVKDIYTFYDDMDIIDISFSLAAPYIGYNWAMDQDYGVPHVRLGVLITPPVEDTRGPCYLPAPPTEPTDPTNVVLPYGCYGIKQRLGDYDSTIPIGTDEDHPHIGPTLISSRFYTDGDLTKYPKYVADETLTAGKYNCRIRTESWWEMDVAHDYTAHMRLYLQPYLDISKKIHNNSCFPIWIGYQCNQIEEDLQEPQGASGAKRYRYSVTVTSRKDQTSRMITGQSLGGRPTGGTIFDQTTKFILLCVVAKPDNESFSFWRMDDYAPIWVDGGNPDQDWSVLTFVIDDNMVASE